MERIFPSAALVLAAVIVTTGCSTPGVSGLRDSFAQQVAANEFVKDFDRRGDDLTFSGPGINGRIVKWHIHIDRAIVEPTGEAGQPYKGTVTSSWYANDQLVRPTESDSNLPLELTTTGLAQECWALWDQENHHWGW